MENLEETRKVVSGPQKAELSDTQLDEIFKGTSKPLWLTRRVLLRLAGFGLLLLSLILMILWNKGGLPHFVKYISLGLFGLGIIIYIMARVQDFLSSRKPKKP
ncbi:MAG: hypothetical protein V1913_01785 [Fibrobacterota bacterium]